MGGISIFKNCVKDGRSMNETKDRWPSTDVWRILMPQKLTVGMVKWEKWYLEVNKYRKEHTKNKSWMSVSAALLSS